MSYSSVVLADSPIRYYRLGETSGTFAIDAGSQAQNGTYTGGYTLNQPGLLVGDSNTAVLLDGSTGYIVTANAVSVGGLSTFSVEFWIKFTSFTGSNQHVIATDDTGSTSKGFDVYLDGTALVLNIVIGNGTTAAYGYGTPVVTTATTYHVVFTYDGTGIGIYLNGVQQSGASPLTGTIGVPTSAITIGRLANFSILYVSGTMDEVAIYNTALSSTQVATHYNAGTSAPHLLMCDGYGGVFS